MINRQTLKCGIAEPPLAQGLQSHGRAGGHSSATAHPQHTRNWHLRAGNCCGTALAACSRLCLTLRCDSDLLHWQILEAITTSHLFPCSQTWCKHWGGETRQNFHGFRKGKGIPVCHTWTLSAFQSSWEGTALTGRPIARLKSRKPKGSSSFPDPIKAANPGL